MTKDELIALYFSNQLSDESKDKFDHLLTTDSDFAKEVNFQKNLKTIITKEEQQDLKAELASIENSTKNTSKTYTKWLIAASIIVILAIPSLMFFGQKTTNKDALFAANFEPYKNVVHPIVRGESSDDIKTKAFIAYEAKSYDDALLYFNTILKEHPDGAILFYKSIILLQKEDYNKALGILESNTAIPNQLKQQQQWYLGLVYLKTNQTDKAKAIFKTLSENNYFKAKQSKKLLDNLSN